MLTSNLYSEVLKQPVEDGGDRLYIVSGYATAAMAFHHLQEVKSIRQDIEVKLLVGMCPSDGLSLSNHRGFQSIVNEGHPDNFQCSYIRRPPTVHSKAYAWFKGDQPLSGFLGSANYTQKAFNHNREAMTSCDPVRILDYYHSLVNDSIFCTHPEAENYVTIYRDMYYRRGRREDEPATRREAQEAVQESPGVFAGEDLETLRSVSATLLSTRGPSKGQTHNEAGLNWGQRPGRNPNQAYIPITAQVQRSGFFPEIGVHFTVLTDDDKTLICTRAQAKGKAIETPHNNSLLGEYFRNRLGLPNGVFVEKENLLNYGRTDVTFYKIDDENHPSHPHQASARQ